VQHVFREWVESSSTSRLPAKSPLRKVDAFPAFFREDKLRQRLTERIQHFFEQRRLRMLTRLGFRAKAKKAAYDKAGGPKEEVNILFINSDILTLVHFYKHFWYD
jgi:hypothetical protein